MVSFPARGGGEKPSVRRGPAGTQAPSPSAHKPTAPECPSPPRRQDGCWVLGWCGAEPGAEPQNCPVVNSARGWARPSLPCLAPSSALRDLPASRGHSSRSQGPKPRQQGALWESPGGTIPLRRKGPRFQEEVARGWVLKDKQGWAVVGWSLTVLGIGVMPRMTLRRLVRLLWGPTMYVFLPGVSHTPLLPLGPQLPTFYPTPSPGAPEPVEEPTCAVPLLAGTWS